MHPTRSMPSTSSSSEAETVIISRCYSTKFGRAENLHRKLLYNLMSTIYEYILVTAPSTPTNVMEVCSDMEANKTISVLLVHIHDCLEQIFLNGLRIYKPDNSPDCWRFIEALNWLNPHMTVSIANPSSSFSRNASVQLPKNTHIRNDKAMAWIYENLVTNELQTKLKYLLSDSDHLVNCYEVTVSFFHDKKFVNALFLCLSAYDNKQYNLLAQIDRDLYATAAPYLNANKFGDDNKLHDSYLITKPGVMRENDNSKMGNNNSMPLYCDSTDISRRSSLTMACDYSVFNNCDKSIVRSANLLTDKSVAKRLRKQSNRYRCRSKHLISTKIRPWVSLPDVTLNTNIAIIAHRLIKSKSQPIRLRKARTKLTVENLALKEGKNVPSIRISQRSSQKIAKSFESDEFRANIDALNPINLVKCDDIKIHMDRRQLHNARSTEFSSIAPVTFTPPNEYSVTTKSTSNITNIFKCLPSKKNIFPFLSNTNSSGTSNESNFSPNKPISNSATGDFTSFMPRNGEKIENRYANNRLFDDIGYNSPSLSPKYSLACKPEPTRGQSLTSYLQQSQRHRFNVTDLERENAHFNLANAMISVIEEIKCGNYERQKEKQIRAAKVGIRKTHRGPRRLKNWVSCDVKEHAHHTQTDELILSDSDTSSTDGCSGASSRSSSASDLSHLSSNSDTSNASKAGDLKYLKIFSVSSHSVNDCAAYAEWAENSIESLSAEGIALSLISKFKDRQLPRAADLLSSATDDQIHMMNRAFDIAPEEVYQMPYTRGTSDWAPPRAQIIFTRHPTPDRKKVLEMQNYRCAGCGMKVAPAHMYSFRYCEYLGKYHCTGCHRNQISALPARVLESWDFSCHPVSVFSYRLLDQIWKVPLFRVPDLSEKLYSKVRALRLGHLRRTQLKYVHDFINTCRFANDLRCEFSCIPAYIYDDVDNWTMSDFIDVRNGTFLKIINEMILKGEQHVYNCELCTAHGFLCEYCSDKQVIFPWQSKVIRCVQCGSCSHSDCWKNKCSKCQRLGKLKKS